MLTLHRGTAIIVVHSAPCTAPVGSVGGSEPAPSVSGMLRALNGPDDRQGRPSAYLVPWRVERIHESHPLVTNVGADTLDFVRVFVHAAGARPATESWGQMVPGETAELCLCEVDVDDAVVTIAWFRPCEGEEYVWRFVM